MSSPKVTCPFAIGARDLLELAGARDRSQEIVRTLLRSGAWTRGASSIPEIEEVLQSLDVRPVFFSDGLSHQSDRF